MTTWPILSVVTFLPVLGAVVFIVLTAVWFTSAYWFFSTFGIKRSVVQIISINVNACCNVVFNHSQPLHLFFCKLGGSARLLFKYPCLEVFVHCFIVVCQFGVNARHFSY